MENEIMGSSRTEPLPRSLVAKGATVDTGAPWLLLVKGGLPMNVGAILGKLWGNSGFAAIITGFVSNNGWQNLVMLAIACLLLYLAIGKGLRAPAAGPHRLRHACWPTCPTPASITRSRGMPSRTPTALCTHSFGEIMRNGGLLDVLLSAASKTSHVPLPDLHGRRRHRPIFGPLIWPTPTPCCWALPLSWASSPLSCWPCCAWALPLRRPLPSASSAALTAPPPS